MIPHMELDLVGLKRTIEAHAKDADPKIGEILDLVGARTVDFLRSYTGDRNKKGRRVHPGGWADRTHNLERSFFYEVHREPDGWVLIVGNTARHAHLVEARGMFVVRGIEEAGGPIHQALVRAVREIAPDWKMAA